MDPTKLIEKLEATIKDVTERNKVVQDKKSSSNPGQWIFAAVLSLVSLIGIGFAMWYASKRGKELAKAKTKLEQQKVDTAQQEYEAEQQKNLTAQAALYRLIAIKKGKLAEQEAEQQRLLAEHAARLEKLKGLKSWAAINEA